jgi:exodeoxyribonuclease VII large subunit
MQYLDDLRASLARALRAGARLGRTTLVGLYGRLRRAHPAAAFEQRRQIVREWHRRLGERARSRLKENRGGLETIEARLKLLSPENVLARGYSITTDAASGRVLRSATETRPGQKVKTKLMSGEVRSVVEGGT